MTTRRHPITRSENRYRRTLTRLCPHDRLLIEEFRKGYRAGLKDASYYLAHGRWPKP